MMWRMSPAVAFAVGSDGSRSTTPTGRGVVAAALRTVDPVGSRAVENETAWRSRYVQHFRRLVEAGVDTPVAWWSIADAGLRAVHDRLVVAGPDGDDAPLSALRTSTRAGLALSTVAVTGRGCR